MLALIGAVEGHLSRKILALSDESSICWHHTAKFAREKAPAHDILCLGDSMMQFGVNPCILEKLTGHPTLNLGLMGGSAASSYFLLRHALESGSHPSAILVNFNTYLLSLEPSSEKSSPPWHELVTLRDCAELCWVSRDAQLFASTILNQVLASLRNRPGIRTSVKKALNGEIPVELASRLATVRNLYRNHGALVRATADFQDVSALPETARMTSRWRPLPVNAHFLRRFLTLAEEHQIRVYWLIIPLSPGQQANEEFAGTASRFESLIHLALRSHNNLRVIDARHMNLGSEDFFDTGHLNRDGMLAMSSAMAEVLTGIDREPTNAKEWVTLSAPGGRPSQRNILEDMDQSLLAIKSPTRVYRRR